jgi:hypothetical protein
LSRLVDVLSRNLPLPPDLAHGLLDSLIPQVPEVLAEEEEAAGSREAGKVKEDREEEFPAASSRSRGQHTCHLGGGSAGKSKKPQALGGKGKSSPGKGTRGRQHSKAGESSEDEQERSAPEVERLEDPLLDASLQALEQVTDEKEMSSTMLSFGLVATLMMPSPCQHAVIFFCYLGRS